jgi:hypothetical protein
MVTALLLTGLVALHVATAQQDIPFCLVSVFIDNFHPLIPTN